MRWLVDELSDVLAKLLNVAIPDDTEDEKQRLQSLSKDQIIEELLRVKVCRPTADPRSLAD